MPKLPKRKPIQKIRLAKPEPPSLLRKKSEPPTLLRKKPRAKVTLPNCPATGVPCPGLHCDPPEFCEKIGSATPLAKVLPPSHGTYPEALLAACARAAYTAFCRECAIDKHALVPTYDKLKDFYKARWHRLARDMLDAEWRFRNHYP